MSAQRKLRIQPGSSLRRICLEKRMGDYRRMAYKAQTVGRSPWRILISLQDASSFGISDIGLRIAAAVLHPQDRSFQRASKPRRWVERGAWVICRMTKHVDDELSSDMKGANASGPGILKSIPRSHAFGLARGCTRAPFFAIFSHH